MNAIISIMPEHSKSTCKVIAPAADSINSMPYLKYAEKVSVRFPNNPEIDATAFASGCVKTGLARIIRKINRPKLPAMNRQKCSSARLSTLRIYNHSTIRTMQIMYFIIYFIPIAFFFLKKYVPETVARQRNMPKNAPVEVPAVVAHC